MSTGELLLTLFIALLVLGPKQLPDVARQLGRLIKQGNEYRQQLFRFFEEQRLEHQLQDNMKKAAEADEKYK